MNYVFMPTPLFCHVWASFGTSFFFSYVMLWQAPDFSFLSDVMPAPCCPSSFRCHALELYPSVVIAKLEKAEAIQYKLLNPYTNIFSRKDYQTGLLRFARNDAGGGQTGFSGQAQK